MLKKLFSHTLIYGLAPHVPKIASLLILPIITQDLTELDFGIAGIIGAYSSAIGVLSTLGLRLILVNSFYKSPEQYKWAWRQIYGFLTIWVWIYGLIMVGLLYYIIPQEARNNTWLIIILNVLPIVLFGNTNTICSTYYQVTQQPLKIGIRSAIFGTLAVGLNLYTISYLKLGYMGWFWASFISTVLSNFSYWYPLNFKIKFTPILNFKWRLLKNSLKVSLPTIPHYYSAYLLDSSDRVVMEMMNVSTGNIGKYNVAYIFGNYLKKLGTATGLALSPIVNEKYKQKKDGDVRNLIFVLQIVFLLITFTLSIWLKEIFYFLIRNDVLNKMYPLGIIIVMGYNYRPMYFGANNKLFFEEKTSILWKVTFTAGLSNVVLNIILIPIFGYQAAAYTTFASLMYMGYVGYFLKIFKVLNEAKYYPLFWLTLTIVLTVVAYYLVYIHWIAKSIITVILILGFFYMFWKYKNLFSEDE